MRLSLIVLIVLSSTHIFGQMENVVSTLEIFNIQDMDRTVILKEEKHFEAPNWDPNGNFLLYNSLGLLYTIDLKSKLIKKLNTGKAKNCNNDHGISADGNTLILSNNDAPGKSRVYKLPITGGEPELVTVNAPSYWHGISPDGSTLTYVANRNNSWDIYSISINGGEEIRLTSEIGLDDGPDYSPDGKYIYYNGFSSGSMEIWRMNSDGSNKIQLTNDSYSNWFPHPSPDGKKLVYISYLEDQKDQHPAMKKVVLKLMNLENGEIKDLCQFTGGQGSINVPSWSPDSKAFAFVSYRYVEK